MGLEAQAGLSSRQESKNNFQPEGQGKQSSSCRQKHGFLGAGMQLGSVSNPVPGYFIVWQDLIAAAVSSLLQYDLC